MARIRDLERGCVGGRIHGGRKRDWGLAYLGLWGPWSSWKHRSQASGDSRVHLVPCVSGRAGGEDC